MKWSAPHPYPTTRNWTHEQGGRWAGGWEKRIPRIRDSLFQHVNKKKGLSGANMGKSIKYECVIQILFTSAETWAGFEVSHSYPFGPIRPCHRSQMVWRRMRSSGRRGGGGIIFSSLQWNLTCWLSSSILPPARSRSAGPSTRALGSGSPRFSCFVLKGSSVSTAAGALLRGAAECCLTHKFGYAGPIKKTEGEKGGKVHRVFKDYLHRTAPPSILIAAYAVDWRSERTRWRPSWRFVNTQCENAQLQTNIPLLGQRQKEKLLFGFCF